MKMILMAWDLTSFLTNFGNALEKWGGIIVFIIGVAMVIASVYFIMKGLLSHGRGQTSWVTTILLLLIGGAFMAGGITAGGGWSLLTNIANGSKQTIEDMGNGSIGGGGASMIIPMARMWLGL